MAKENVEEIGLAVNRALNVECVLRLARDLVIQKSGRNDKLEAVSAVLDLAHAEAQRVYEWLSHVWLRGLPAAQGDEVAHA